MKSVWILILLFFSAASLGCEHENVWLSKSHALPVEKGLYLFTVYVKRNINLDHGKDVVTLSIQYLSDDDVEKIYHGNINVPGEKGYVKDISFIEVNNESVAIQFDVEMKAMNGMVLPDVVLVDITGKHNIVYEAEYFDLYQKIGGVQNQ